MASLDARFSPPRTVRLRVQRAAPLEVWQLVLKTKTTLSRAIRWRPERLLEGLELLHRGEGRTRDGREEHHACAGYAHLVIGGGRSADVTDEVLAKGPTPFTRLTGAFIGDAGGHTLAAQHGFHAGETLVLDLGQTSIKVSYAGQQRRLERDLERLPRANRQTRRQREAQRVALRDFLAEAVCAVAAGRADPAAVVVALPGEISDDAVPGRSSYVGTAGHATLLPDVLVRAGVKPKMLGVLNDAELAAASASLLPQAAGKTLVLTLGFGIGAALLAAPPP